MAIGYGVVQGTECFRRNSILDRFVILCNPVF